MEDTAADAIGQSQFSADPHLNGEVDDFRAVLESNTNLGNSNGRIPLNGIGVGADIIPIFASGGVFDRITPQPQAGDGYAQFGEKYSQFGVVWETCTAV